MYWSLNVSPHGQCWVEGDDVESALATVREHYGRSATAECVYGADERPLFTKKPPADRCYLAEDATWRQAGGAPMLSTTANLLMSFGASYQEALSYQIADEAGDNAGKHSVMSVIDARNKLAARAKELASAIKRARQLGKERRAGKQRTSDLSDWDLNQLLYKPSVEEHEALLAAYRGR